MLAHLHPAPADGRADPCRRAFAAACVLIGLLAFALPATAAPLEPAARAASAAPAVPMLADASADQTVTNVTVLDNSFDPTEVTIPVGAIVRWINGGQSAHSVTSDDGLFHAVLAPGQQYSLRFLSRGEYKYHCYFHPQTMTGRVVVVDQAPGTPPAPTPGPTVEPGADAIVFDYFADGTSGTRTDLFVIDPDGTGRRALTTTASVSEAQPSWSPERRRVAFTSTNGDPRYGPWTLSVLDLATGQGTRVSAGPEDYEPDWHPDGNLIVFTSLTRRGQVVVSSQLATVRSDGLGPPRPLVRVNSTYYSVGSPNWSPDGNRISFVLESGSAGGELYTYDWLARTAGKLYDHPGWNDIDPAWSPDGRFLAFASGAVSQPWTPTATVRHDIWVLDTATGTAGAVVHVPGWDLRGPSWSADGTELVFSAKYQTEPSAWGLYVAPAFGGVPARPLTAGVEPDWGGPRALPPTPGPQPSATLPFPPDPPTLEPPPTVTPPPVTPGPSPTPPAPPTFTWPTLETPEATPTLGPSTTPTPTMVEPTATPSVTMAPAPERPLYLPMGYRSGRT